MRKCANPHCDNSFSPSKHNPHQRFCGRKECNRFRDAERQERYYHENIGNAQWARQHLQRKKRERINRIARKNKRRDNAEKQPLQQNPDMNKTFMQLVAGVICMISGAADADSVERVLQQCIRKGGEVYPEGIPL